MADDLTPPSSMFFLILFLVSQIQVRAQQPYGTEIDDCTNQHNSSGMLGYFCNTGGAVSCQAFLTFTPTAPYNNLSSIAALLGTSATTLAAANNEVEAGATLGRGTTVLVPVSCACTATPEGRFYQGNATYVAKSGDTLLKIATRTFQGLTSCQALQAQGLHGAAPESLAAGRSLPVPLRCACPSAAQAAAGGRFLVSYVVAEYDDVSAVAAWLSVHVDNVTAANELQPPYTIYPSTTLLVPVNAQPNVSRIQTSPSPVVAPPAGHPGNKSSSHVGVYIGVAVAVVSVAAIASAGAFALKARRKRRAGAVLAAGELPKNKKQGKDKGLVSFVAATRHGKIGKGTSWEKAKMNVQEDEELVWEPEGRTSELFRIYEFWQLLEATSNFSEENKLGQGGFGSVFRGLLPDGFEIAVKRLASHSGQGFTEFKNEIQLVAKLQHTNLVKLLGCCSQGEEKILIYEYLPNKSLDFFIFDETRRALLDWTQRLAIIEGIAQGLLYLHKHSRLRVIHRDLKASNILLDCDMNPKISDFGLAKIFSTNDSEGNTRRIAGTYGYMAPEYVLGGIFSVKSDVFSFGVLILEIVSGKRTSSYHEFGDFINLLGHAWQLWKDGLWLQLVDASLDAERHAPEMKRCINIALLCAQEDASDRPTMSDVVAMLSSETKTTLAEPEHPAYFHVRVTAEEASSTVAVPCSVNGVTVSALDAR